jgi:hypothetical protein
LDQGPTGRGGQILVGGVRMRDLDRSKGVAFEQMLNS